MVKYFNINSDGYSVRCKMYCNDARNIGRCIISMHGFGGHKDNKATEHFAEKALSKFKNAAVVIFDLPCHGEDARPKISLNDCTEYIRLTVDYFREAYPGVKFWCYATSFGGYVTLKYIHDNISPFEKIVLRCPAVTFYSSLRSKIMTPEAVEKADAGKDVLVGFDRKVKICPEFIGEIRAFDVMKEDFMDRADDILVIHGTKDEIIPFEASRDFADSNVIEFMAMEKADHRFMDPHIMNLAIARSLEFMFG